MIGQVDGVMLGRAAYQNPWLLVHADAINQEVATATASMLRPTVDPTGTNVLKSTAVQQEDAMPTTRRRVVEEYLTTLDRIRVSFFFSIYISSFVTRLSDEYFECVSVLDDNSHLNSGLFDQTSDAMIAPQSSLGLALRPLNDLFLGMPGAKTWR
jgi:tRNA-dihydrouridine synthase